jgi:hypothetical protein
MQHDAVRSFVSAGRVVAIGREIGEPVSLWGEVGNSLGNLGRRRTWKLKLASAGISGDGKYETRHESRIQGILSPSNRPDEHEIKKSRQPNELVTRT